MKSIITVPAAGKLGLILMPLLMSGCQSSSTMGNSTVSPAVSTHSTVAANVSDAPANPAPSVPPLAQGVIRIKAGGYESFKDSAGNVWAPDNGFSGGDTIERPDVNIANTSEPGIYRSEHYGMDSFSYPLPNGKYLVKLHFCETFDGVTGPGQRVFSFNVQGRDYKDFDVWVKAGGPLKAYVESVPVDINDGKLKITFTSNIENPQINGIEIIPQN